MTGFVFAGVKLQTKDITESEEFFREVFGFEVTHRYGGQADDPFEEIVMTIQGAAATMLKFVELRQQPKSATGATIQIRVENVGIALAAAAMKNRATVKMAATDYPEAGVKMAIITTNQDLEIELVQQIGI